MHRRVRRAGALAVALLALPGRALAAGTTPLPATLAGGRTAVTACGDLTGAAVRWAVTGGRVTAVTVGGLPAACAGGTLSVALVGLAGDLADGSALVDATGSAAVAALSAAPSATAVGTVALVVVGP